MLTNAHVVTYKNNGHIELYGSVLFRPYNSNEYYQASIAHYDINKDLCLLELDSNCEHLHPIAVGYDAEIDEGEKVYAVGNALNHGIGIAEGIISIPYINIDINDNRTLVIQCDIVIASGSSGGALLNKSRQLIGITTFRVKDQNGYIAYGVGFAIPIITIKDFLHR